MLHPIDFVQYIRKSKIDGEQVLMARIVLNVLFDPERYPVDLSEIAKMRCQNRVMTRAFLAWCAIDQSEWLSWPRHLCYTMTELLPNDVDQEVV